MNWYTNKFETFKLQILIRLQYLTQNTPAAEINFKILVMFLRVCIIILATNTADWVNVKGKKKFFSNFSYIIKDVKFQVRSLLLQKI